MQIIEHEPLARHTSWRIGGPARYYVEVDTVVAVQAALAWADERGIPVFVLGSGTNLLVRDGGYHGLVLRYVGRSWQILPHPDGDTATLHIEAGAPMAGTARRVSAEGWAGLEWAEGLPGSLGGSVYGNAGCYGGDIAGVLVQAWLLVDDQVQQWQPPQLGFGYRTSALKRWHEPPRRPLVLAADLHLQRGDAAALAERIASIAATRKSKTPWGSSCGSVFKNPPPVADGTAASAGQLIDRAGLKGTRIGGAEISTVHGNYIVNVANATAADVLALIEVARRTVQQEFGIELELEVQVIGDDTPAEQTTGE